VITRDKKASAHYEHTVVVRKGEADVLSDHSQVEVAVKNNSELKDISEKN
jgi:methionyl aminopeptidase